MLFELLPYVGAGPLRFGMTVDEIRSALRSTPRPFFKSDESEHATDAFDELALHVFYTQEGYCEAIEFGGAANVSLNGSPLQGEPFSAAERTIATIDPETEYDSSGMMSLALGLAVYCPGYQEDRNAPVQGVLVFRRGYYE